MEDLTPEFPKGLVEVDVPKNSEPQSLVLWYGKVISDGKLPTGRVSQCSGRYYQ
jgi:hypothetical protein